MERISTSSELHNDSDHLTQTITISRPREHIEADKKKPAIAYEMADQASSIEAITCLQDLLKTRAVSQTPRSLTFYPLGNHSKPSSVTYSDLYRLAQENSRVLSSVASFQEGRPVLLHLQDHWDIILWFWSTILANAIPVLSTPFSNVDEHRQKHAQGLSSLLESPLCVTRDECLPLFEGTGHTFQLHTIETITTNFEDNNAQDQVRNDGTRTINGSHSGSRGETPAMLMLTSGSTGNAKAVVLTHRHVLSSVSGKTGACALPAGRPFLNWIGLDHVGAFVEIHLHAMWVNEDQIHVQAADIVSTPLYFLDLLSRHCVSRSFAPNFFLASLVKTAAALPTTTSPSWDLSNLKFLVSGGEANDIETCVAATSLLETYGARRGVIAPGFGMTETCAGSIYNVRCPDYDLSNGYKVACLGKCIKGMEMRVTVALRRDGKPEPSGSDPVLAQPNQPGDLEVRGDMVFKEYYRNPAATADAFTQDGWFRTGDRAVLDSDGNLCLVGRVKEVINILGVKVPTGDLQSCLDQAIKGCHIDRLIVFPSRGDKTEQVTVACRQVQGHTMTDGEMCDIDSRLVQACMMVTASRPIIFMLGPESLRLLPTTTLGKISRAKMQSLFEDGAFMADVKRWRSNVDNFKLHRRTDIYHGGDQETTATAATVEEMALIEDFKSINTSDSIGQTIFQADTSLWELGYTSMDIVRLKHAIDARLGLFIPIIMIMKNPTARLLAAAISRMRSMNGNTHKASVTNEGQGPNSTAADGHSKVTHDGGEADQKYDPVVAFRTHGTKTPLWLVHPGVGEVLVFVGLAQQLSDDDRPLYALRARGFEPGETRFGDIEETVSTYVAAIRRVQPEGPYAIAGYSYGAMLAFEIAKRLDGEHGQEVRFLGSFNLPPNIKMRMRQLNWNMCLLHLAYFLGLTTEDSHEILQREHHEPPISNGADGESGAEGFSALGRETALARVLGISDAQRMSELGLTEYELTRWADVAYGLQSMAIDYEPSGVVDSIHVFHAEPLKVVAASREEWLRDHLAKWADFSRSAPTFTQVGGAHYTMLGPDHVSGFAPKLKEALRDRGV